MKAVILAGGEGRRLLPYTTNFPKPLMPIGEKPILEIVINQLRGHHFTDIIVATGYLEELIRAFFQNGEKHGVSIRYSKEEKPLGTAGPLNLIRDQLTDTFLLMNGDILTDLDFTALVDHHRSQGALATIGLCRRTVHIDFGIVTLNGERRLTGWQEKPQIEYLVSTGIYVLEPAALSVMPAAGFFNLPDLVEALYGRGRKVSGFIHEGYWLDIGRAEDYQKACEDYAQQFGKK